MISETNYEYVILPEGVEYTEGITGYEPGGSMQATLKLGDTAKYEFYLLLKNEDGTHTVVSTNEYNIFIYAHNMNDVVGIDDFSIITTQVHGNGYQITLLSSDSSYDPAGIAYLNDDLGSRALILDPVNTTDNGATLKMMDIEWEK